MPELRALTYKPVAQGICPCCGNETFLRFVYNPYGDDQLMCVQCGNNSDEELAEAADLAAQGQTAHSHA